MRNNLFIQMFVYFCIIIVGFNCGEQVSGVETTNGATVSVRAGKVDGVSPPFTYVYLFDNDYIPCIDSGLGIATASGRDGHYSFSNIKFDTISVAIVSYDQTRAALVQHGTVGASFETKLDPQGSLSGVVNTTDTEKILIFLRGTGYYVLLDKPGQFEFKSLPSGVYNVQAATVGILSSGGKPVIRRMSEMYKISVLPNQTAVVPLINIQ